MHIKFIRTVLLGLVLSVVCSAYGQKQEVHILAVNDMHATIEAFPKLAAIADSLRKLYPSLLVLSAGDNRTGNPLNDMYEISSYPMVSLMNQVGFNATAVGNHEFDVKSLAPLMGYSNFSYICANMFPSPEAGLNIVPTKVFDVNGIKVGIIGVIQVNSMGALTPTPRMWRASASRNPRTSSDGIRLSARTGMSRFCCRTSAIRKTSRWQSVSPGSTSSSAAIATPN